MKMVIIGIKRDLGKSEWIHKLRNDVVFKLFLKTILKAWAKLTLKQIIDKCICGM